MAGDLFFCSEECREAKCEPNGIGVLSSEASARGRSLRDEDVSGWAQVLIAVAVVLVVRGGLGVELEDDIDFRDRTNGPLINSSKLSRASASSELGPSSSEGMRSSEPSSSSPSIRMWLSPVDVLVGGRAVLDLDAEEDEETRLMGVPLRLFLSLATFRLDWIACSLDVLGLKKGSRTDSSSDMVRA